jgi:hypothetical protein
MPDKPTLATAGILIPCVHISRIGLRVQTFVKNLAASGEFLWRGYANELEASQFWQSLWDDCRLETATKTPGLDAVAT